MEASEAHRGSLQLFSRTSSGLPQRTMRSEPAALKLSRRSVTASITNCALYGPVLLMPLPDLLYSRGSKQYTCAFLCAPSMPLMSITCRLSWCVKCKNTICKATSRHVV